MIHFRPSRWLTPVLLPLVFLEMTGTCHAQTWSGLGSDNNWSTASNWVGGVAPVSSSATAVVFANPAVRNSPVQNIATPFNLNRLDINSASGSWALSGQSIRFTGGGSWIRYGGSAPISISNDWIIATNTDTVDNGPSVTLTHSGDISGAANLTVTNGRSLRQTGTVSGTGRLHVVGPDSILIIDGTVSANSGIMLGVSGDGFSAGFGTLRGTGVINGNVTASNSSTLVNNLIGSSGTLTVNGQILVQGSSRRLRFDQGITAANGITRIDDGAIASIQSGASLAGTGNVELRTSGKLSVSGAINSSKIIDLDAAAGAIGNSTLWGGISGGSGVIAGNIVSQGGRILGSGLTINGNIEANHTASRATLIGYSGDLNGARTNIVVNGQARFLDGTGGSNGRIEGDISGTGLILVEANTLVSLGGSSAAVISGVETTVRGGIGGSATLNGLLRLEGGTLTAGGTITSNGEIRTSGAAQILNVTSGTTFNGQTIVESGLLTIGGIMQGSGSLAVQEGSSQTLQNSASRMRLTLNAFGNLVGTAGSRYENTVNLLGATMSGPLTMDAAVNVGNSENSTLLPGATLSVAGVTTITDGTLRVEAGASVIGGGSLIVNIGALDVQGAVVKNVTVNDNAFLRGVGEVEGTVDVFGYLDPGNSAGTIRIRGAINLGSTSTVCIEIGGTTPGTGHDVVQGRGTAPTLHMSGGDLMITLINGFVPAPTDEFIFFRDFSSITGRFGGSPRDDDRVYFAGGSFAIAYAPSAIALSDFQPVPEPTPLLLALAPIMTVLGRRSRRTFVSNSSM